MTLTSSLRDRVAGPVIVPGEAEFTSQRRSPLVASGGHRPWSLRLEAEF